MTCQVFAPLLLARPGGRVVITSSISAIHGQDLRAAYAATKAGLSGLVRALAVEWGPLGVNVNAVGPGVIETPLTKPFFEDETFRASVLAKIKLGRIGAVEDLMGAALYLACDASSLVTGTSLVVDGGWTAD